MRDDISKYLANIEDLPDIRSQYFNTERLLRDCPFISHAGADWQRILQIIALPVLMDWFGDRYFLHNRSSGGSTGYKRIVKIALHACKVVVVIVSKHAAGHDWVNAEVAWTLTHAKPHIICRLDDTPPADIHQELASARQFAEKSKCFLADFRTNVEHGQHELKVALKVVYRNRFPFKNAMPVDL